MSINNPVLLIKKIIFTPNIIKEIYPNPLPNLYTSQQMIISVRYETAGEVHIKIKGNAFNVPVTHEFNIVLAEENNVDLSFLP